MKEWFIKIFLAAILFTLCALVLMWGFSITMSSEDSVNQMLWRQSVEKKIEDAQATFQNQIYDRYSRLDRNLNDYQYIIGKRVESLENRVKNLEKTIQSSQSQINIENNAQQNQR